MGLFHWRTRATLYLHFPCFDGVISGVLTTLFLERTRKWKFKKVVPVNYGIKEHWLRTHLAKHNAVVDFLYHPEAEFWADHHSTTFLTDELKSDIQSRSSSERIYDEKSGSCAALLWRHLQTHLGPDPRLEEMVRWADKIDSASYDSVQEAVSDSGPAITVSRSLAIDADKRYCRYLVQGLRRLSLAEIAASTEVQNRFLIAQQRSALGMQRVRNGIRLEGNIAVFDTDGSGVLINRYSAYQFYPHADYSIGIVRLPEFVKITAMRNPWLNFESVNLGSFMQGFGGGGHQRVGSLIVRENPPARLEEVIPALLQLMTRTEVQT